MCKDWLTGITAAIQWSLCRSGRQFCSYKGVPNFNRSPPLLQIPNTCYTVPKDLPMFSSNLARRGLQRTVAERVRKVSFYRWNFVCSALEPRLYIRACSSFIFLGLSSWTQILKCCLLVNWSTETAGRKRYNHPVLSHCLSALNVPTPQNKRKIKAPGHSYLCWHGSCH